MRHDALIALAQSKARELVDGAGPATPAYEEPTRRIVIGDPQASLQRFLSVLARHRLLSDDGWLLPSVQLVSVGDHFDWGSAAQREEAASDGLALLSWLAAHDAEQVTLIAGNHDLGRVGELANFTDDEFLEAHNAALTAYRDGDAELQLQAALLARHPELPTAELAARDFAAFRVAQRDLVRSLLLSRRFRLSHALDAGTMVCHAGVTTTELATIDYVGNTAEASAVSSALNQHFDNAISAWGGKGRLSIDGLHRPGDADFGEGGGMFYHRPANLLVTGDTDSYRGPARRRYDPRTLPAGLTQVVGHISDAKCRKLFGDWAQGPVAAGRLRFLSCRAETLHYQTGLPLGPCPADESRLLFVDGGMNRVAPENYEVFELAPA